MTVDCAHPEPRDTQLDTRIRAVLNAYYDLKTGPSADYLDNMGTLLLRIDELNDHFGD